MDLYILYPEQWDLALNGVGDMLGHKYELDLRLGFSCVAWSQIGQKSPRDFPRGGIEHYSKGRAIKICLDLMLSQKPEWEPGI